MILDLMAAAALGYLLGSINSSILVGRLYGKDIREHGSGNAGLTNTIRVLGKKAGIFVLAGDIIKGIAACLASYYILSPVDFDPYMVGGAFAIIGHNWPLYFKFKGGKGALTAVTVAFMIDPLSAGIMLAVFMIVLLISKTVSLSTITTVLIYPVTAFMTTGDIYVLIYGMVISGIIIYKHRSNIDRLIKGTEAKISSRDK